MASVREQMGKVYMDKVIGTLEKTVRIMAMQAYQNIILATPVGNPDLWKTKYPPKNYVGGRARANWNIDVNNIDASTTESTDAPDVATKSMSGTASYKLADTIYISNNLPYIQRLNDGWSTQAPSNFVETGVTIAKRQTKQIMKGKS